jgi:hypothetical protein
MRAHRQKLRPEQIDKNAYRHPVVRDRAPPTCLKDARLAGYLAISFYLEWRWKALLFWLGARLLILWLARRILQWPAPIAIKMNKAKLQL